MQEDLVRLVRLVRTFSAQTSAPRDIVDDSLAASG